MKKKFCSCRMCKRGRKSGRNQAMIHNMDGGAKCRNKIIVKKIAPEFIQDKLILSISIPYTD